MLPRTLNLTRYTHSFFLFGPRQVGKTHLIETTLKPNLTINLLSHSEFLRYSKDPTLLSQELKSSRDIQIVIDEIQRCPDLLNEIHMLIESQRGMQFILTGSSARKLRRAGVNLLGGRALTLHLYPFTHEELKEDFNLENILRFGSLPKIVLEPNQDNKRRLLQSYVETYLKEEIQQEALTRNVPGFARFLELAAFENGNILNFNNIAREVGVHSKTVKEYFQILEDTLIGFFIFPYTRSHRSRLLSHPKFYFFDPGIVAALRGELSVPLVPGTSPYGRLFEHWVITEILRLLDYRERETRLSFFRTSDGAEVDVILEGPGEEVWAVEIKANTAPRSTDLKGLRSFIGDHHYSRAICVCLTPRSYQLEGIHILPWREFFTQL